MHTYTYKFKVASEVFYQVTGKNCRMSRQSNEMAASPSVIFLSHQSISTLVLYLYYLKIETASHKMSHRHKMSQQRTAYSRQSILLI